MIEVRVRCDDADAGRVRETLRKWNVQFYEGREEFNGVDVTLFTALVPEFVINDIVSDLVKAIDLRKGHSSVVWSSVSGKSVKYSSSAKNLEKFRGRWTIVDIESLIEKANSQARVDPLQLTLGAVASIVALFGLVTDSIVMIISAMLLSPILGPLYGFSLNVVMGKGRDAVQAILSIGKLLLVIFLSAFLSALILRFAGVMPETPTHEILLRANSGVVYILIALVLGYAGVVAIVSRIPEILAGVSIAAALVPPTAVVGISLAMGWWEAFFGSLVLTAENVLGLLAGSVAALYVLNVSPRSYYEKRAAKMYTKRTLAVLSILMAAIILLELVS